MRSILLGLRKETLKFFYELLDAGSPRLGVWIA